MRDALILELFLFASLLLLKICNANTVIRRDDGQHDVDSSSKDSVEFVHHEAERAEKARKLEHRNDAPAAHLSGANERNILERLSQLSSQHFFERATENDDDDSSTRFTNSFDLLARSLLTRKTFKIECCRGGVPQITQPDLIRNFTYNPGEYLTDDSDSLIENAAASADANEPRKASQSSLPNAGALNCRAYYGTYFTPPSALLNFELSYALQVVCKCPDIGVGHQLDTNCRRLPTCKNNGFRSSIDPQKCLCLQPFFGEKCEKFCDRGQRLRGLNGRDYCSCSPFYTGEECREMVCMNGGREDNGRCICAPQYLGYHCEIDTNRTKNHGAHFHTPIELSETRTSGSAADGTRFQRFGDHVSNEMFTRDISGTIFSLIMIIVLVVSMYLLMKHRMQARYLSRRPDLLGACNFPGASAFNGAAGVPGGVSTARHVELMPTFDETMHGGAPTSARTFPFRNFVGSIASTFIPGDGGPPPYIAPGQRSRRNRDEVLPPLPTYEDATKLPPLRQNVSAETAERNAAVTNGRLIEMVTRTQSVNAAMESCDGDASVLNNAPPIAPARRTRALRHAEQHHHQHHHRESEAGGGAQAALSNVEQHDETLSLRSAEAEDDVDKPPSATNDRTIQRTGSINSATIRNHRHSDVENFRPVQYTAVIDDSTTGECDTDSKSTNKIQQNQNNNRRRSSESAANNPHIATNS